MKIPWDPKVRTQPHHENAQGLDVTNIFASSGGRRRILLTSLFIGLLTAAHERPYRNGNLRHV
jgi:hypothetical protein